MSTDQTERFRSMLEVELDAQRIRATNAAPEGEALGTVDPNVADVVAIRATEAIDEIVKALQRIDDGTYGSCLRCAAAIPVERLEAVPAAALCVTCQGRAATLLG